MTKNDIQFSLQKNKTNNKKDDFKYKVDQFADIKILRYKVPGFEQLSLQQKKLIYYLSEAARCGRDIIFDQHFKYNLTIRKTLDNIIESFTGDRDNENWNNFMVYVKRFWFSNGFHHHYSSDKFFPEISMEYFDELMDNSYKKKFPIAGDSKFETFKNVISRLIFDRELYTKKVSQDTSKDIVRTSAVNFYEDIDQMEVEDHFKSISNQIEECPVSHGLNSKLIRENGSTKELVYKEDGLYGPAIKEIIKWLNKASEVAENNHQKSSIEKLISYYKTGDLKLWDEYNIKWVQDLESHVDFINGFIENYTDPMGIKATWESVVNFKDIDATKRTDIIAKNAQWFEDHSPVDTRFKKEKVKGVSAKVITVVQLGGDCYPASPIGINLPNADWIRKEHGSKSVTMENITMAYDKASQGSGMLEEFVYREEDRGLSRQYAAKANNLHTDLHECLGHGSGQLLEGTAADALKNYASPLEE
ncbi:MAG: dipeptidyl peptidase 3, partial [Bacteroidales bacterium]|nr:dipeptidyl peptidase 3 [Bacteroidales bacterium]